ncbi:hypothetical protein [Streptomyces sp. Go40/10]|uniref:hypothetical protein n=1 Tax=Streptomyces sp. Go40/10 TaxID=2825844 RepID=UPI002F41F67E
MELLTLRTDYAAKTDADLELVEKEREHVRADITALHDQLHTLDGNHAPLPSLREALSGHSPATCPEPGPDGAATTGSSPAAPPASDGVSVDGRAFTPATALRPGEQVQVDTTRLDVLALFDAGRLARPDLTITVDVAARAILAAVLCPSATKAADAALLLAEMAVPHPARPIWPDVLDHAPRTPPPAAGRAGRATGRGYGPALRPARDDRRRPRQGLRLRRVHRCLRTPRRQRPACPAPRPYRQRHRRADLRHPQRPVPPAPARLHRIRRHPSRPDTEKDTCYSVPQLQDLLDGWLVHYHLQPHEGLRHPMMPKKALTPNQMWAALVVVAGHVPVPLTGSEYLELLPMR